MEKHLGLPVTPFMLNLDKPLVLAKGEIFFLSVFITPLWKLISNIYKNEQLDVIMGNCTANLDKWKEIRDEALKEEAETQEVLE